MSSTRGQGSNPPHSATSDGHVPQTGVLHALYRRALAPGDARSALLDMELKSTDGLSMYACGAFVALRCPHIATDSSNRPSVVNVSVSGTALRNLVSFMHDDDCAAMRRLSKRPAPAPSSEAGAAAGGDGEQPVKHDVKILMELGKIADTFQFKCLAEAVTRTAQYVLTRHDVVHRMRIALIVLLSNSSAWRDLDVYVFQLFESASGKILGAAVEALGREGVQDVFKRRGASTVPAEVRTLFLIAAKYGETDGGKFTADASKLVSELAIDRVGYDFALTVVEPSGLLCRNQMYSLLRNLVDHARTDRAIDRRPSKKVKKEHSL